MASYNTQQLQEIDGLHHIHPFTDHKALMKKGTRIITRADGVYLWDSDGNKILDGMAGLWCVNIGYGRQELVDVATNQMQELPYYNNSVSVPRFVSRLNTVTIHFLKIQKNGNF